MFMLPIAPHFKILIESIALTIMLGYALFNVRTAHLTALVCVGLSVPLAIDVGYLHAIRGLGVTVMLNIPATLVIFGFVYVKIFRKGWKFFKTRLAVLFMSLLGR